MQKNLRNAILAVLLASLAACSSGEPPRVKQEAVPAGKINLDVLTVTVLDRSLPPSADSPYNHYNYTPTIASALRQWSNDHFSAVGPTGEATIVIRDASLKSEALPYTKDMFTRPQASKYIAHAEIGIVANGHEGHGQVSAEASRFVTLPENPTAVERQNAYNTVLNGLMHDISINIDAGLREHMQDFVVTAPVLDGQLQPGAH